MVKTWSLNKLRRDVPWVDGHFGVVCGADSSVSGNPIPNVAKSPVGWWIAVAPLNPTFERRAGWDRRNLNTNVARDRLT